MKNEQIYDEAVIRVKLKTLNNSSYDVIASPLRPIKNIQNLIESKTKVPPYAQRLLHKGFVLDVQKTLADYRIEQGDTIQLVANRIPSQNSQNSAKKTQKANQLSREHARTKKYRQLQERVNGFRMRRQQSLEVISQNKHVISQLMECLNINFMTDVVPFRLQRRKIQVGEWVDARDGSGQWVEAQIVNQYGQYVLVHFNGWDSKCNQWISTTSQRIMPFHTHTAQIQKSQYLSPTPAHERTINSQNNLNFKNTIEGLANDLPVILDSVSALLKDMNFTLKQYQQQQSLKNVSNISYPQIQHTISPHGHAIYEQQQKGQGEQQQRKQDFQTPNKQNIIMGDNISNKCQDDVSNKCDNDDVSSKSFKSKRSQGLVDTASMKSLIIDQSRKRQNKVFLDTAQQAQSVRSVKNQRAHRHLNIINQEYILEEESQNDQDFEDRGRVEKAKLRKKMKASQLAPLLDRVGRLFIDIAPHIALMGHTDQSSLAFSQNLSTKTNEGSLLSKLSALNHHNNPVGSQNNLNGDPSDRSYRSHAQNCSFQIPILLTPFEIDAMGRLLEQQRKNIQNLS